MAGEPSLSVVVTVLNEAGSVDELYRRTVAALDGASFELVFVDDGSTDGTFAALARLHAGDPRVRAVRLKRNFGQHPAMHAGLARARGQAIVTMDGDLQNAPEDIPEAARRARSRRRRVGPPRRPPRLDRPHASVARDQRAAAPLHGRADLRLRLRVQRVPARGDRAAARLDRQAEVHEGARALERRDRRGGRRLARAARGGSRYSPLRLVRLALHVVAGFWPQPVQWIGVALGLVCTLAAAVLGVYGVVYWIDHSNFPGRSSPERASCSCSAWKDSSSR